MKLIIAEKPELARAIAEAIPGEKIRKDGYIEVGEYLVTWAAGHLLEFKMPEEYNEKYKKWDLNDLPIYFENWGKKIINGKGKLVSNIKSLLKNADEVINAGDPDDEGQYLIDEIVEYLNYNGKVSRILINDNNIESIKKAFTKIETNEKYKPLGIAAESRSIADLLIGINLTRFFTMYHNSGKVLSIGRVQTPTLAMVVNRDNEIKNHIKEKYYELFLNVSVDGNDITLKYKQDKEDKILEKEKLEEIIKMLENKNGKLEINKNILNESAPLPFNLAKLQIEANKRFGYSAQKTQDITQSLREKHKAITYNRSDSEYLSEEHFKEAPKLIPIILKKMNLDVKVDFSEENKSKAFNDSNITAHHGIIPTFNGDIDSFSKEEKNIYDLIAKRYIIQFMEKKKIEKTEAELTIDNSVFTATSSKTLEKGYSNIYSDKEDESTDNVNSLSKINSGSYDVKLNNKNYNIEEKESQPKKYYTEASLLKDMTSISKYVKNPKIKEILIKKDKGKKGESGSIGTPATRAAIIEGLFKKGYLTLEGKNIKSTPLANEYLKTLPEVLKGADMTALWWLIQEDIKDGKVGKEALIKYVLNDVNVIINMEHKKIIDKTVITKKNLNELSEGEVIEIKSDKGEYYKGIFQGKIRNLPKEYKYFDNTLKITNSKAEKLFKGDSVEFNLKYKEKEYKQKMKLVVNGDYLNITKA